MIRILIGTVLIITGLSGCSSYRITRNQLDQSATWNAYQTFAFVDTNRIEATPRTDYQAAITNVKQAVTAELTQRGYQQSRNNPDLLVDIGAAVNEKTQTRSTTIYEAPGYTGQRRYRWQSQEVPVGTYEEGTVRIQVVDTQREALVWDVAVASVLNRKKEAASVQLGEAVAKAFVKFPDKK
jgi:hypothetical protein